MISTPFGGWRVVSSPVSTQRRQPSSPTQLELEFPGCCRTLVVTTRLVNGTLGITDGCCPVEYGYDTRAEVLGTAQGVLAATRSIQIGSPVSLPLAQSGDIA